MPDILKERYNRVNETVRGYISAAVKPPARVPAWQWCEQNIQLDNTSYFPGRISFDLFPCSKSFFNHAQNPRTRRLTVQVSAQSAKTQNAIMFLLWRISEKPAPAMWAMAAADHCEEFGKKRLWPAVEDCPPVSEIAPDDRESWTKRLIRFDSMNLMLRGSNSRIGLQSDPVGLIICDERREWKKSAIDLIRKRTRTFADYLEISMGTAGVESDELHRDFLDGSQTFFHFRCPECNHSQPLRFGREATTLFDDNRALGGVVWDSNETTKPDGKWDFDELRKTVRYECESCGHRMANSDKPALLKTIHEYHRNPSALPSHVSVHWNALYMPWVNCSWDEIAVEFIKANHASKPDGGHDTGPLIAFTTETLGEPWREVSGEKPPDGELMQRCGNYVSGEEWEASGTTKIITVDYQHGYIVYVFRQWRKDGSSRLIKAGKMLSFDDLRAFHTENGVQDRAVWIDCAHKPGQVLPWCARYGRWIPGRHGADPVWDGWTPLLGDDAKEFHQSKGGHSIKTHWKKTVIDPGMGTTDQGTRRVPRYSWSNPYFKDQLYLYQVRGLGTLWEIPKDIGADYVKQIQATDRRQITDAAGNIKGYRWHERGRHDYGDCELMQLVVAGIAGIGKS